MNYGVHVVAALGWLVTLSLLQYAHARYHADPDHVCLCFGKAVSASQLLHGTCIAVSHLLC